MFEEDYLIKVPSSNLNQKEPNELTRLYGLESMGGPMRFDIRLYAMLQVKPPNLDDIVSHHMYNFTKELELHMRAALPESKEWKSNWTKDVPLMFEEAGYGKVGMQQIPNEYDGSLHRPWFRVFTNIGVIKMGWRKRVIEINYSDSIVRENAKDIFKGEEVTMIDQMIHAWGREKAVEYLKGLRSIAGI